MTELEALKEVERLARTLDIEDDLVRIRDVQSFNRISANALLQRAGQPRVSDQLRDLRLALVQLDLARAKEGT